MTTDAGASSPDAGVSGSIGANLSERLGIFARTFRRDDPVAVAAAVAVAGYPLAHWNFAAIGKDTLGRDVDDDLVFAVRRAFDDRGIGICSVSATYNMAHPDSEKRIRQTAQAAKLIELVPQLGADVVTLCTGTRDADNMWRAHPDNAKPDAWDDLRRCLEVLMVAADKHGVTLGVEPETGNVIVDAAAAARLLAEVGTTAPVGIIFDPANLLTMDTVDRQEQILTDAVEAFDNRIIGAQAKDVVPPGEYSAAGAGFMDYDLVFRLLQQIQPVPLVVQDASESDAARVRDNLITWSAAAWTSD